MKVWEKIVEGVNWGVTKAHVERMCLQFGITPCDLEGTINLLGCKPVCSNKCEVCLKAYLDKELKEMKPERVEEGQLCLF